MNKSFIKQTQYHTLFINHKSFRCLSKLMILTFSELLLLVNFAASQGIFNATGNMTTIRGYTDCFTLTVLNNGKVLAAGGGFGGTTTLSSAELYDPNSGTWALTGSMNFPRVIHTATLLADGRVLVVGGYGHDGSAQGDCSAEIYDPSTGTWSITGALSIGRHRNGIASGAVTYAGSSWLSFGVTDANGEERKELLPGTYTFRMTYAGKSSDKSQDIAVSDRVAFIF
jgi:hypothetical protein